MLCWTTLRALGVLGLGVACAAGLVHFVDVSRRSAGVARENADTFALVCLLAVVPLGVMGAVMTWTAIRRWVAGSRRWQVMSVQVFRRGLREWVQLIDGGDRVAGTLKVRRWISASGFDDDTVVWFAGDPQRAGLLAMPGGARSVLAYRSAWYPAPRFGRTLFAENAAPRSARPRYKPTPPPPPPLRGGRDDTSFPSPRMLRRRLAFVFDVVVHLAVGFGVGVLADAPNRIAVAHQDWAALHLNWALVIGGFLVASFVDRVLLQAVTHTTVGKAVFGLVVLDRDTGRPPRLRWLLAAWLVGGLLVIQLPLILLEFEDMKPERPQRYLLPAVRRRDIGRVREPGIPHT